MQPKTNLETLAKLLEDVQLSADPSQDLLIWLSLAYASVKRLEQTGAIMEFNNRPLVLPALERAFREGSYIRAKMLPIEWLQDDFISRFGRAKDTKKLLGLLTHEE